MSFLANRPLVFIDTETTGLHPQKNCIVEIAAVKFHQKTLEKLGEFSSLVQPHEGAEIVPQAMSVNKIASEDLAKAPQSKEVLEQFLAFTRGSILVGHRLGFDLGFIEAACQKVGIDFHQHSTVNQTLDTTILAWPLFAGGVVKSLSLENLCKHFEISNEGSHRALQDVLRTFQVYKKMMGIA